MHNFKCPQMKRMNKGHQLGKTSKLYAQQFFVRKGYQLLAKKLLLSQSRGRPHCAQKQHRCMRGSQSTLL